MKIIKKFSSDQSKIIYMLKQQLFGQLRNSMKQLKYNSEDKT